MTEQQAFWSVNETTSIRSYTLANFRTISQIQQISEETQFEMEVVGNVLPFKTNNYVVEQLIDWDNVPNDPMYVLTFPQKGMLIPEHYDKMAVKHCGAILILVYQILLGIGLKERKRQSNVLFQIAVVRR